jgi:hypothetical protein
MGRVNRDAKGFSAAQRALALPKRCSSSAIAVWDRYQGRSAGILACGVQNTAVECAKHPVPAMRTTVIDWARATPNDTAAAAMISETASASVAASSTPRDRFFDNTVLEMGDAKPTFPVSAVMTRFVLRESLVALFAISRRTWANPLTNKGDSMVFG